MPYVDGFVIPLPKANIELYKKISKDLAQMWIDLGATSYVDCIQDDVPYGEVTSFPRAVQAKDDEVIVFSWVTYPDKAARDACNEKIQTDPRMAEAMKTPPFDGRRMIFGGFEMMLQTP